MNRGVHRNQQQQQRQRQQQQHRRRRCRQRRLVLEIASPPLHGSAERRFRCRLQILPKGPERAQRNLG